jgi:hypothetical protein
MVKKLNLGQKLEARPYHLHHDAFINEGQMVALQLSFPNASEPIPADESYLTSLCPGPNRAVYAGTSGERAHLIVSMQHGVTGFVFDLGAIPGAKQCLAVLPGEEKLYAALNGPRDGFIVEHDYLALPPDCMQEWWFRRTPYRKLLTTQGKLTTAVIAPAGIIGVDQAELFLIDKSLKRSALGGKSAMPQQLIINTDGSVYGLSEEQLSSISPNGKLGKQINLPHGRWEHGLGQLAPSADGKQIFLADDEGRLFSYAINRQKFSRLGQTPLAPVSCLAALRDGRLFGFCGEKIQHLFCRDQQVRDLGIAVSVVGRRRYGYDFSNALVGPDGRLYFAEHDRGGHLWMYFPSL